ncbi:hypothetical protein FB562_2057 [Homoserinimonas aerilata]|uniref:Uncharacterized protein n=1 Tax=Homoserinimonas aerilata TaxID=1162970 RepID=A0A542YEM3_9MICO|nr:hypothetical protein [Homoserinimonas aerilata]TQL46535.1 hypothetical protein FB562_2057 [Homoserinimonas aerilata]
MTATASASTAIREFAAAVRAALDDLPADDLDELTEGLEADLLEQATDAGADFTLGDPQAYAEELRAAAGLPQRDDRRTKRGEQFYAWLGEIPSTAAGRIRSTRFGSAALDFAVSLRPFWWVLRGWVVFQILARMFTSWEFHFALPPTASGWLLLTSCLVVSIQWGRGRWLFWKWLHGVKILVSIIAVITLPFMGAAAVGTQSSIAHAREDYAMGAEPSSGLRMNGSDVTNIFAYDADGTPLREVQLFDQTGNPLMASYDPGMSWLWAGIDNSGYEFGYVPNERAGRSGWNVFPLDTVDARGLSYDRDGREVIDRSRVTDAPLPFEKARPLSALPEPDDATEGPSESPAPGDETPAAPESTEPDAVPDGSQQLAPAPVG